MTTLSAPPARSVADLTTGAILAAVEIAAPIERVFRALTDPNELVRWWGSPVTYPSPDRVSTNKPKEPWVVSIGNSGSRATALARGYL